MYLISRRILWMSAILLVFPTLDLHADGPGLKSFSDGEGIQRKPPSRNYSTPFKSRSSTAEDGKYQVTLPGPGEPWFDPDTGGRVRFTFIVKDKANDRQFPLLLDNMTAKVNRIAIYQGKLVVLGEGSTLNSLMTTVIDLAAGREIDAFIGFGTTLSESGRFLTYLKFFPPQSSEPEAMSDLVLIYDLADSADGNRMRGEEAYKNDPIGRLTEVGHPVYPEGSAGKKNYRIWVREEKNRHAVIPNGFFWFDHDKKFVFADRVGEENYLIVVDLSRGLNNPIIRKMEIDLHPLLQPGEHGHDSLHQEAKELKLEEIQDLKNGRIRIRVSSQVPLQKDQFEFSLEGDPPPALSLHQ